MSMFGVIYGRRAALVHFECSKRADAYEDFTVRSRKQTAETKIVPVEN